MPKYVPVKVSTLELAALAFAAQRVNGVLHKDSRIFDTEKQELIEVTPNKVLMRDSVTGIKILSVTEQDRADAETAIQALQQDMTMSMLKGRKVSDFVSNFISAIGQDEASERDCGLFAFLPNMYGQLKARQQKEETVVGLAYSSKAIGNVGDRVTVNLTVISARYLSSYNCWSVFGHDQNGNCVSFLTGKQDCSVSGTYAGKIKRVGNDTYHNGAMVTQLNFVKRSV